MSWWDTSNFSNLASQAFKNAQKKIDKVLDIEETEASRRKKALQQKATKDANEAGKPAEEETADGGDFWSSWMGTGPKPTTDSASPVPASWNLPWASGGSDETEDSGSTAVTKGSEDVSTRQSDSSPSAFEPPKPKSLKASKSPSLKGEECESKKSTSSILEAEFEGDEGTWVGSSGVATEVSGSTLSPEEKVKEAFEGDHVNSTQNVDLIAVVDNSEKDFESVQSQKPLTMVKDDSGNSWSSDFNMSTAENKEMPHADKDEVKQSLDIQEMSVSSAGGWDVSDSVVNLVEAVEKDKSDIVSDVFNYHNEADNEEVMKGHDNVVEKVISEDTFVRSENLSVVESGNDNVQDSLLYKPTPVESSTPIRLKEVDDLECVSNEESTVQELSECKEGDFGSNSYNDDLQKGQEAEEVKATIDTSESSPGLPEVPSDSHIAGLIQGYVNVSLSSKEPDSAFKSVGLEHQQHSSLSDLELGTSATSSEFEVASVDPLSSTGSSEAGRLDSSADTVVDKSIQGGNTEERYSLFGVQDEQGEEDNDMDRINSSVAGGDSSVSPASSFVKCMLEEAMEESGKEDSSSDNHSNGSKSESSKLDSEFEKSIHSGQDSSDDIETTTSSDIEIISAPGSGGGGGMLHNHPGFDLSPLKISIQQRSSATDRHNNRHHHHFDSQSSSSTQSKCGDQGELSPERGEEGEHTWREEDFQHPDLEAVQEEGADNPYHPERLLKKLAEMAEVLQARESKLVSMSKDNHQLVEDVTILRNQLQQSEETRESETADLKALTDEFTVRIGESEKKLQAAIREKESLKQQLTFTQTELEKRSQNSDVELLLEEKTEQVQELLKEGEKLSKQQLQSSTIIKKLRAKEKETDATLTSQKKKLEDQTAELDRLRTVLDSKEDMESKQADAINQLNAAVQKQEQDHAKVLSDLEDAQEKNRGLQTALDKAYKEIAELHRSNASQDSKAQEVALSKETSLREELKMTLEREQQRFRQEREAFIMQADDLRLDMTRLEKEHNRREDLLREEIAHLQERLQQDEARSQDVSHSITSATRPLLRQIENLQATYGAQSNAWEKVEKSLTDRLAEAQIQLAMAQEKERTACESEMEFKAKATTMESANARLKQEKAQLVAQRESDQFKLEELQDSRNSFVAQLETSKQALSHELTQIKMEKVRLESHLTSETNKLENEKKKAAALEEQMHILERERPRSRGTPSPSPSMSVSRQDSLMGSFYERSSPGGMNLSFTEDMGDTGSSTKTSVYENLRHSGATIVMENLQSQLKMREGEISHLQTEIAQLERTRESMARELVNLSNQNDELRETKTLFENLEEQYKELNNRYSAILLMYGEKEEQVQELRLDLQDVKEMYKTQIDALLAK